MFLVICMSWAAHGENVEGKVTLVAGLVLEENEHTAVL